MSKPAGTMPDEFTLELRERNTISLWVFGWLSTTLVPLFWGLDWILIPNHIETLGLIRLGMTAYGAWLLISLRRRRTWVRDHSETLGPATVLLIEVSIAAMCWLHDGYESQYYAGVCLSVLATGTLFVWRWQKALSVYAAMYGMYMLPLLLGIIKVESPAVVVNNQFFLLSTVVIVVASQARRHQMEKSEFYNVRSLAETKGSLEDALTRLRETDRAKSNFFNNVTHELRTPLTMILSPLENILSGELGRVDTSHEGALRLIWRNAIKLLKLINDLLDLARIEEQFLKLRRNEADLGKLLKDLLEHTAPLAARKNIDVSFEERSRAAGFFVDSEKIERVFVNLVSNALKFTDPHGAVRVTLDCDGEIARIRVSDTGVGIPQDKLGHIFERFSQADASVTRRYGGTGIGLAFAREITRLHAGDISVESEIGVGSTFMVTLPRGAPEGASLILEDREPVESKGPGPVEWAQALLERSDYRFLDVDEVTERRVVERGDDSGKATKVLVVEDTVELLRFLHLQLQDQHAVYLARNGRIGLELAIREKPDVIVSDYMMDEMDGLTMIAELRKRPDTAGIPIILLTAERSLDTRTAALGVGADTYLEKPFSPKVLRASVDALLKRRGREVKSAMRAQVRSLEAVSAGLAHEIRNPLTYIKNAVFVITESVQIIQKAMADDAMTPDSRTSLIGRAIDRMERMRTTADRGVQRVEEVLEVLRRYAREGYPTTVTPIEFDAMVRDVVEVVSPKGERTVTVNASLEAVGQLVECIPDEMQQVIRNLIQNAIDASHDGGVVSVRTKQDGDQLLFEVEDKGHGIPRELQSRIFTPFFSTKAPGDGMGLGLAIVDQIVKDAGGTVELESTVDVGTLFQVRLPTSEWPTLSPVAPAEKLPPAA